MTYARWTGSAWSGLSTFRRWTGSAWQALSFGKRWNGSSWVTFAFDTAVLAPTSLSGTSATAGVILTSGAITSVTVTGGSGSYTYLWHVTTISGPAINATLPSAIPTQFAATLSSANPQSIGSAVCQVTDTTTGAVFITSNACSITITFV